MFFNALNIEYDTLRINFSYQTIKTLNSPPPPSPPPQKKNMDVLDTDLILTVVDMTDKHNLMMLRYLKRKLSLLFKV